MNRKLIFLDIDGTLTVSGQNTPPESAVTAIRRAQENGHSVFLCTGRNPSMLAPLLRFGFDGVVGCAGGYIVCGGELIYDMPMTDLQRDAMLDVLQRNGVLCIVETRDATFGGGDLAKLPPTVADSGEFARWMKVFAEDFGVRPMSEYDGRPVYKMVFMCFDRAQLSEAEELLGDEFNFCIQGHLPRGLVIGELINRAFDKGRAVERVCEHLGADIADTIGFGDSMNDLEMLKTVGFSVCMANGDDNVKKHSDMVCPPVDADGLAHAFAMLGLV